jgi:hypothetical protein
MPSPMPRSARVVISRLLSAVAVAGKRDDIEGLAKRLNASCARSARPDSSILGSEEGVRQACNFRVAEEILKGWHN